MVISLNVQRRDLMAAQKAIVAARTMPMFEAIHLQKRGGDTRRHSGKSSPNAGRSREDAAKVFKVSDKSVQQAKAILLHAPDLVTQVEDCATSLAEAYATLVRRQGEEAARQATARVFGGRGRRCHRNWNSSDGTNLTATPAGLAGVATPTSAERMLGCLGLPLTCRPAVACSLASTCPDPYNNKSGPAGVGRTGRP